MPTAVGAIVGSVIAGKATKKAANTAAAAQDRATAVQERQVALAEEQWDYYKTNFQPLEQGLIAEVKTAGSAEEQERAAGEAHADVMQAHDRSQGIFRRTAARYGIRPGDAGFASALGSMELARARDDALAQNQARKGVREAAFGKRLDVVGLGRNLPAQASMGLAAAATNARGMANTALSNYQFAQQQALTGVAPIVSAVQKGLTDWFNRPQTAPTITTPSAPPASSGWGEASVWN
ncbi:MAG: hypothetical protein AB1830_13245 [Pseudomonadota bacterium]